MNIGAQSGLLAAIVSVAVAISVILRARPGHIRTLFTLFCADLFVHFLASFFFNLADHAFWLQLDWLSAVLLPPAALAFFGHFLWRNPVRPRPYQQTSYLLSAAMAIAVFTPIGDSRIFTGISLAYVFAVLYLCAYFIYIRLSELESRREQTRLRYLLILHLVSVTFVLLGLVPSPLTFLRTWGDLVTIFFLYFVSQSLMLYRLLDLQELLGRGLVLTAVALILATVFGVLVLWAGGSPAVSLFHTFVASLVILILFEPLRDKVESSTRRWFFHERADLRNKLEKLRRDIANTIDLRRMSTMLLDGIYEILPTSHVNAYIQEEGGAGYRLVDHRGPKPVDHIDVVAHRDFFAQLGKTPTVILAEMFERRLAEEGAPADSEPHPEVRRARNILNTLSELQAGICVPLLAREEIVGLWNLQDENGLESFSTDEIAQLVAIGEQAAINIENSRIFERIRERDRLAALGEMAAGLAHEIRNPLGAIKGAAQYLDPEAVGQDAAEFLGIIIEEADRLNTVVDQFLNYARPFSANTALTNVNEVLQHSLRLVAGPIKERDIKLIVQLQDELPPVDANQQLTQVFLNLLTNAIEAMQSGGRLEIRSRSRTHIGLIHPNPMDSSTVVSVEISDTGPGIPADAQPRVFLPFFTTKKGGTGLGLAISQRIVESFGGHIRIHSTPEKGTTFTVLLPSTRLIGRPEPQDDKPSDPADDLPFHTGDGRQ